MKKTNTIFTKLHADLLRFISKSLPNKTSRYDAFMYLLENQIELINQYKNGSNAPRHYTILGLSNKWKWDRKTVMSFLNPFKTWMSSASKETFLASQFVSYILSLTTIFLTGFECWNPKIWKYQAVQKRAI